MKSNFIPNDPEQILSDTIALYQSMVNHELNPADPERIIIDCMAYRESLLRGTMEYLMRQNFVQYAEGTHLDNWGELFGVPRLIGETDENYRKRILGSSHASIGTLAAYQNRILSIQNVSDVLLERKCDDPTLPPGTIRITPIMRSRTHDMIDMGTPHTTELEQAIDQNIYVEDFGVIGAQFIYKKAIPIPLSGMVTATSIIGYSSEQLKANIKQKVSKYFADLSLKFEKTFNIYDLERAIEKAEGILTISEINYPNIPTKNKGEFYTHSTTIITIQQ